MKRITCIVALILASLNAFAQTEAYERYSREDFLFGVNERVKTAVRVFTDEDGKTFLAEDSGSSQHISSLWGEKFYPVDVPEEVANTLSQYPSVSLDCLVKIRSVIKRETIFYSKVHTYTVEIEKLAVPALNPTEQEIAGLTQGSRATIVGEIAGINEKGAGALMNEATYFSIKAAGGRHLLTVEKAGYRTYATYGGGILENLKGKPVKIGEVIALTVYVDEEKSGRKYLRWYPASDPYLMRPSPDMMSAYEYLREKTGERMRRLARLVAAGDFHQARLLLAKLRQEKLTRVEQKELLLLRGRFPEKDRPVIFEENPSLAAQVDRDYGVFVESMTKKGFENFARAATAGLAQIEPLPYVSYIYELMDEAGYTNKTMSSVLARTINERLKRLEKDEDVFEAYFADNNTLEVSMRRLAQVPRPEAGQKILGVIRYLLKHRYYLQADAKGKFFGAPFKFDYLLSAATGSLLEYAQKHPTRIRKAIKNPDELHRWLVELVKAPSVYLSPPENLENILGILATAQ